MLLLRSLILSGPAASAAPTTASTPLSPHARQALEAFGLRDMAEPPEAPAVARDAAAARRLRAHILVLHARHQMLRTQWAAARQTLEEAAQLLPTSYWVRLALAEVDSRTLNEKRAQQALDRLISEYPDRIHAYELKARLLEAAGRVDEALRIYSAAFDRWPACDTLADHLAKTAFGRGDLERAISVCTRRLEREPRHFFSLWMMGYIHAVKARAEHNTALNRDAAGYYERALESRPSATQLYPLLAEVYIGLNQSDKARATLQRGLVADPTDREIRQAFERLVSPQQKPEEILQAYKELAGAYPTAIDIQELYAAQLIARQDFLQARDQYRRLLELQPKNVKTLLTLGGLEMQLGRPDEAQRLFEQAIELAPEAETYESVGRVFFLAGRYEDAAGLFEKVLAASPKQAAIYLIMAQTYQEMKQPEKAVEILTRGLAAVEQPKSRKLMLIRLSNLYEDRRDYAEATANLRKAYELERTDMPVFFSLLTLLLTADDPDGVRALIAEGRDAFQNDKNRFQEALAALLMEFHFYTDAIPEWRALLASRAADPPAEQWTVFVQLAIAHQRLRQTVESERLFGEATQRLGGDSVEFQRFAALYYAIRYEHAKAHDVLVRQLDLMPVPQETEATGERFAVYEEMVFNLGRQRKYNEIPPVLNRAERELGLLDPKEMKLLRAHGYIQMKRLDDAVSILTRLLEDEPDDPQLHYELGAAFNEARRIDDAEKELRQALALIEKLPLTDKDPELRATVLNHLGYMFVEENRNLEEAAQLLQEALKIQPRAGFIVDSVGWLEYKKGNTGEAVKLLERAVHCSNEDPTLYDHLGDAYAKGGQNNKALECWRQALTLDPSLAEVKSKIDTLTSASNR